jgi:hypothetical protein
VKSIYTLIALLVAVVLGAFIFFYESKKMTTDQWRERKHYTFNIKASEISKLYIDNKYGKIRLEKRGDLWKITDPLKVRGDNTVIESIISKLENLKTIRKIKLQSGKEDYGVGKPRVKFSFWQRNKQREVSFGDISVDNKYVYIQLDKDNEIQVVDRNIFESLNKEIIVFRYKKVVDFKRYSITKIELKRAGKIIIFERDKKNNWQIISPAVYKANNFKCDEVLGEMEKLEVENFVEDGAKDVNKYGLDKPWITIRIFEKEKVKEVEFGLEEEQKIYVRRAGSGSVYSVKKNIMDVLDEDLDYFKEDEEKKKSTKKKN